MEIGVKAPHNLIRWRATDLGSQFGAYNIYRRKADAKANPWQRIGRIVSGTIVGSGNFFNAEKYATKFFDYELACAPTSYDYRVELEKVDGALSLLGEDIDWGNQTKQPKFWYLVNNVFPHLNFSFQIVQDISSSYNNPINHINAAGRDYAITNSPARKPGQHKKLQVKAFDPNIDRNLFPSFERLVEDIRRALSSNSEHAAKWALVSNYGEVWYGYPYLESVASNAQSGTSGLIEFILNFVVTSDVGNLNVGFQDPYIKISQGTKIPIEPPPGTGLLEGLTVLVYAEPYKCENSNTILISRKTSDISGVEAGWIVGFEDDKFKVAVSDGTAVVVAVYPIDWNDARAVYGMRIDWNTNTISAWIDGIKVAEESIAALNPVVISATLYINAYDGADRTCEQDNGGIIIYPEPLPDEEIDQGSGFLVGTPGYAAPEDPGFIVIPSDPNTTQPIAVAPIAVGPSDVIAHAYSICALSSTTFQFMDVIRLATTSDGVWWAFVRTRIPNFNDIQYPFYSTDKGKTWNETANWPTSVTAEGDVMAGEYFNFVEAQIDTDDNLHFAGRDVTSPFPGKYCLFTYDSVNKDWNRPGSVEEVGSARGDNVGQHKDLWVWTPSAGNPAGKLQVLLTLKPNAISPAGLASELHTLTINTSTGAFDDQATAQLGPVGIGSGETAHVYPRLKDYDPKRIHSSEVVFYDVDNAESHKQVDVRFAPFGWYTTTEQWDDAENNFPPSVLIPHPEFKSIGGCPGEQYVYGIFKNQDNEYWFYRDATKLFQIPDAPNIMNPENKILQLGRSDTLITFHTRNNTPPDPAWDCLRWNPQDTILDQNLEWGRIAIDETVTELTNFPGGNSTPLTSVQHTQPFFGASSSRFIGTITYTDPVALKYRAWVAIQPNEPDIAIIQRGLAVDPVGGLRGQSGRSTVIDPLAAGLSPIVKPNRGVNAEFD
jgi:hypothetical protein